MDSIELNPVELEDGINYLLFYVLDLNKKKYAFLANESDPQDLAVRKIVVSENELVLERLDEEEFTKVMIEFDKRYNKKEENNEK